MTRHTLPFYVALLVLAGMVPVVGSEPAEVVAVVATVDPPDTLDSIELEGPGDVSDKQPITVQVLGLPAFDPAKPYQEQTAWLSKIRFRVSAPDATIPEVEQQLILQTKPLAWDLRYKVVPNVPGVYVLLCIRTEEPYSEAFHRVTVGDYVPPGPKPPEPRPDDPVPPPTVGLHVLIIDDENERGLLPQSQINIFTSRKLVDWLDANCAKAGDGEPAYRFSSNDSLAPGAEARRLELPVWVEGWDAVMNAVRAGRVKLPAWAVTNGNRGVIEPLPLTVDAALARLQEFAR